MSASSPDSFAGARRATFGTTHWSLVLEAGRAPGETGRAAREQLCATYWYPLYAWLRRSGHDEHNAADLVQGFFAQFLARGDLERLEQQGGRFRSFLLVALRHHVARERERAQALKRGGDVQHVALDGLGPEVFDPARAAQRFAGEAWHDETPERAFERAFALELLASSLDELRREERERGQSELFARLEASLQGELPEGGYAALAADSGQTAGALKLAVFRLRRRWRAKLTAAVARLVQRPQDVEDEFAALLAAVARPAGARPR